MAARSSRGTRDSFFLFCVLTWGHVPDDSGLHCDQNFMQSSHNPVTMHIWEMWGCREEAARKRKCIADCTLSFSHKRCVMDIFRAGVDVRCSEMWKVAISRGCENPFVLKRRVSANAESRFRCWNEYQSRGDLWRQHWRRWWGYLKLSYVGVKGTLSLSVLSPLTSAVLRFPPLPQTAAFAACLEFCPHTLNSLSSVRLTLL